MSKFGFKEITQDNWLNPDDVLKGFVRISKDGKLQPITSDKYLHNILEPKLLEAVPVEVKALFEVARGQWLMVTSSIHFIPLQLSNFFAWQKQP